LHVISCTDIGYKSFKKHGEALCGDSVEVVEQKEDSVVMVLADGLGSGAEANTFSMQTSKLISAKMTQSASLESCVLAAAALPVCSARQIACSTFTAIRISNAADAEIVQCDNPDIIMLRNGRFMQYPKEVKKVNGKKIAMTKIRLQEHDTFIAFSDGVVNAGVGKRLPWGWEWENVAGFMEKAYKREYSANALTGILLEECSMLYDGEPGDDTTVCTVKIRPRCPVNLLIGPPSNPRDAEKMMRDFFSRSGRHIVCGGTTSALAAKFLGKKLQLNISDYVNPDIPPVGAIEGVDLVTEGIVTLNRVVNYSQDYLGKNEYGMEWNRKMDAASRIARFLFEEGTDVHFFVGKAVNPAHQNPGLPINFSAKMRLMENLAEMLKKMGKRTQLSYF
jgi:hypothetical protein